MNLQRIESTGTRLRILALHGSGGNSNVTRMQLENLGLLNSEYEITCINGPISTPNSGHGLSEIERIISGPWYSWLPSYGNKDNIDSDALLSAICDAVKLVLEVVENEEPFDGFFGFSQGGVIASLVNGLPNDKALQTALLDKYGDSISLNQKAFNTTIVACAAVPLSMHSLRMIAGLGDMPSVQFNSVHLIGKKDNFKPWSESLALSFNSNQTNVYYLDEGHEINRNQRNDAHLANIIRDSFSSELNDDVEKNRQATDLKWKKTSELSSRAVNQETQITEVEIARSDYPNTVVGLLAAQPANAPLFRVAREQNKNLSTTYGQLLAFCKPGGEGDLRRIGVESGDVVAYLAPSGGNAVAATAFLAIASQTCAVPFSANMSEADGLLALEQYNVKHVILFEGVIAKGAIQAMLPIALCLLIILVDLVLLFYVVLL